MITTKVKSNISFTKLLGQLPKIIDKCLNGAAKDSAKLSKSNIDNSVAFDKSSLVPLSIGAESARARGALVGQNIPLNKRKQSGLNNIGGNKPLKYTGTLYNSIKANKNNLTMAGYAKEHFEGFTFFQPKHTGGTFTREVPPRPFIGTTIDKKTKDIFIKSIDKALIK